MRKYGTDDAIAAVATALSPAALGIVRTSGTDCIKLAAHIFSKKEALLAAPPNSMLHGWAVDPVSKKKIDEVTVCVFKAPKSFTGEDSVEFICHGGPAVVLTVYRLLIGSGFRAAEGGEFTFRSFINGKTDLTRAEAVREIIEAGTGSAAELAAGRLSGGLFSEIRTIKEELLTLIASIDVQIEYPEDEETTENAFSPEALKTVCGRLQTLCASWAAERIFKEGCTVVLAGRTNAGKSSLFNALLKEDRAIVSDIHGTTRDWLEAPLDFGGIPVRLYDTAGIRYTGDKIEAIGVERSLKLSGEADMVLYLIDSAETAKNGKLCADDIRLIRGFSAPIITVFTKSDLPVEKSRLLNIAKAADLKETVLLSAKTADGIKDLTETARKILLKNTKTGTGGAALGNERQKDAAFRALQAVKRTEENAAAGFPLDLLIEDLEEALSCLGEITGDVTSDDILEKVFSGFCVGK